MSNTMTCGKSTVTVTAWNACYNNGDDVVVLSCTVISSGSDISGVGLMLNDSEGLTLASTYTALSNNNESVTPALNLPPGDLKVGDNVFGVVSGEADGQHYFFEQELTIEKC